MGVQVQTSTRDGQGNPLSILKRQFISFSYGGRDIEDFDLLVVFSSDRLSKELYAPFKDTTTEQEELDGQMFWRSSFNAGQLNFVLATDGITSAQLEDFKRWFQPGIEKELILSEYHNRAILARVSSAPQISLLPFEKEVEVNIAGTLHKTKTSLYKGEISISFVMDDPYWYSLVSVLKEIKPEDLKLIYEDGIPHLSMLKNACFLADKQYFDGEQILNSYSGHTFNIVEQNDVYLYYCGTAAEKPILEFDIDVEINNQEEQDYYYYYHYNNLTPKENGYITLQKSGQNSKFLYFSLPSLLTSFNKAIDIVKSFPPNESSILDLRRELRDNLYNYYTRSYVIGLIDAARKSIKYTDNGLILSEFQDFFFEKMSSFLDDQSLHYKINCKNGDVFVTAKITKINSSTVQEDGSITFDYSTFSITENAGNIIKSNYLNIDTRTLPEKGFIQAEQCILISTNTNISNFIIDYKYKYL